MFNFLKKIFAKQEIPEEKIELSRLNSWLDEKAKPLFDNLNNNITQITNKINNEKEKVNENLKTLENAQLQNPKIPERAKTIMEGNRAAFIKKVGFFFNDIDLKYNNYNELTGKCNNIENGINALGKSTARSYQVLNEFFAREAESIANNIKNIENYSKDIKNSIKNSKISTIDKIKNNIINIQQKIKLKQQYSSDLEINKNNFENNRNKKTEIEKKINELKASVDHKNYEKLLSERKNIESGLNDIENKLFHDFSALEKALKKYAKIAFENGKLITDYLSNTIKTLSLDNNLEIIKILNNLKNVIERNELELDAKKGEKALLKIKELNNNYFINFKNRYGDSKQKLNEIKSSIENNKSNKELEFNNNELKIINENIENINNKILNLNNESEKINIEKLKENLQKEINDVTNAKITVI
ncbi:MAG: hypothetical protein QF568_03715 [Flavobacteriales bacterium]|jgi:hypothetical protein|nr:hypothetical protein [Flavobacteriales bacterium]|tara:strand:+ start:28322 stop:29575 length:1254 start_codon:yes stop_codon:yes gene_type:complete